MKKLRNLFFIGLLLTVFQQVVGAPRPVGFTNYAYQQGLKNRYIRHLTEDQQGFLWIATNGGVYRFDGSNFKNYTGSSRNNQLLSNKCRTIYCDSKGQVWVGTTHGVHIYDPIEDAFTPVDFQLHQPVTVFPDKGGFPAIDIKCIYEFNGQLFFGTRRNGILVYDLESQQPLTPINNKTWDTGIKINDIAAIIGYQKNQLMLAADNQGLVRISLSDSSAHAYTTSYDTGIPEEYIKSFDYDNDSNLWIGSDAGLTKFNFKRDPVTFSHYFGEWIANATPTLIKDVKVIDEDVWCATDAGIWILDRSTHLFTQMTHAPEDRVTLPHQLIKDILVDRNKQVWVATDNGLSKYAPEDFIFNKFNLSSFAEIIAIHELNETLILGASDGLHIIQGDQTQHIATPLMNHFSINGSEIWLATNDGLFLVDLADEKKELQFKLPGSYTYILIDQQGRRWIGKYEGLFQASTASTPWTLTPIAPELITRGVTCIKQTGEQNFLISQWDPLFEHSLVELRFDEQNQTWNAFSRASYLQVNDIQPAPENGFWIATDEEGLFHYTKQWNVDYAYNLDEGLPSSDAKAVVLDSVGNLWVSTMRGIALIENGTRLTQVYDMSNGLPAAEFKKHAVHYGKSGQIYFGSYRGWSQHNPKQVAVSAPASQPYIGWLSSGSGRWNTGQIKQHAIADHPIELSYTDQVFNVFIGAINLSNNDQTVLAYQLRGFENNWRKIRGNGLEISYTNIKPGKYWLELKASNEKGNWSKESAVVPIYIAPPVWQTWWFRIGAFALLAVVALVIGRNYIQRLRRREAVHRTIIELEQKALRSQMNPHFIFNSLNSVQSYIGKNETELAIEFLASFSKLMRMILQASIDGKITLAREVEMLSNYARLEQIRFDHQFDIEIICDEDLDTDWMMIPPMLIQPAVENAIIHGLRGVKNGKVTLHFHLKDNPDVLYCTIQDNGIGREASNKHNKAHREEQHISNAVRITKERLQFLFQTKNIAEYYNIEDLFDEDQKPAGTAVTIAMPVTDPA